MQAKSETRTLEEFIDDHFGKRGRPKREKFEQGYEAFKLGAMLQEARLKKGLTQEQLAERCGTNKEYISKRTM